MDDISSDKLVSIEEHDYEWWGECICDCRCKRVGVSGTIARLIQAKYTNPWAVSGLPAQGGGKRSFNPGRHRARGEEPPTFRVAMTIPPGSQFELNSPPKDGVSNISFGHAGNHLIASSWDAVYFL